METPKFLAKIDLKFHWRSSGFQTETSDFGTDFLFLFLNGNLTQESYCYATDSTFEIRLVCPTIIITSAL